MTELAEKGWQRQPYRPLFAAGFGLAWIGVFHWLLFALRLSDGYRRDFHALVQVQGFLTAFALGFLLTMIPRRTATAPPALWQVAVAVAAPIAVGLAAWFGALALAQALWIGLVAMLVAFVVRRFRSGEAGRRPPTAFVWIPLSFLAGAIGAVSIASFDLGWYDDPRLYRFGWVALTQVMFVGLILGVGSMLLPLITRKESSTDADRVAHPGRERALHAFGWLALMVSCYVEGFGDARVAFLLRAAVAATALVANIRLYRPPTVPGLHRRLVWFAGWMIPVGYLVAALVPDRPQVGLHLVFLGAFALMTLSVGLHVTLAHSEDEALAFTTPPQVRVFGGFLAVAIVSRALVDLDPARSMPWLGLAAGSFLLATLAWAWLALPRLLARR